MEILHQYQMGSGQLVNMAKSAIFSAETVMILKERVKNVTGIQNEALCEKYLGLPTAVGRSTKESLEAIPTKIRGLMNGWGEATKLCCTRNVDQIGGTGYPYLFYELFSPCARDLPENQDSYFQLLVEQWGR